MNWSSSSATWEAAAHRAESRKTASGAIPSAEPRSFARLETETPNSRRPRAVRRVGRGLPRSVTNCVHSRRRCFCAGLIRLRARADGAAGPCRRRMSVRRACRRPSSTDCLVASRSGPAEKKSSSGHVVRGQGPVEQKRSGVLLAHYASDRCILRPLYTPRLRYSEPPDGVLCGRLRARPARRRSAKLPAGTSRRLRGSATMPPCEGTPTARTGERRLDRARHAAESARRPLHRARERPRRPRLRPRRLAPGGLLRHHRARHRLRRLGRPDAGWERRAPRPGRRRAATAPRYSVDVVSCLAVIEHVDRPDVLAAEA